MKNKHRYLSVVLVVLSLTFLSFNLVGCQKSAKTTSSKKPTITKTNPNVTEVTIENFAYNHANVEIKAGTSVHWTNKDNATHTVTSDDGKTFDSKDLDSGKDFTFVFKTKGAFAYHCTIHPNLTGKVTVK